MGCSGAGWKTVLSVQSVSPLWSKESKQVNLLGGTGPKIPETLCLSFKFSEYDEFDCGGPHAFALACEMLRLAKTSPKMAWLKNDLFQQLPISPRSESFFDLDRRFDMKLALRELGKAQHGDSRYNPENSTTWMSHLLGLSPKMVGSFRTVQRYTPEQDRFWYLAVYAADAVKQVNSLCETFKNVVGARMLIISAARNAKC